MKSILNLFILCSLLTGCDSEQQSENLNLITKNPEVCRSQTLQNLALWDYLNDRYLWNDALDQSTNHAEFESLDALLADVKRKNPIDRWSQTADTQEIKDFGDKGLKIGYGILAKFDETSQEFIVGEVAQDSNAHEIGLRRGDRIIEIDNKSIEAALNDGSFNPEDFWGPANVGESMQIKWRTPQDNIIAANVTQTVININTVSHTEIIETGANRVGYLVFRQFSHQSEQELNQAFTHFTENNIDELIIDLRYNGGGLSNIANQLASQIAGDNVYGRVFASYINNANHSNENSDELFNLSGGINSLNLTKVVFLTTSNTGSASEMLINSLNPHIEVQLVGHKTHGKLVGFVGAELCEKTIFAVIAATVNSVGFGENFTGFPVHCPAEDSVPGDWGDMRDPLLKEAMYLIANNQCSE